MDVVCLIGNGSSIVYNSELAIDSLTAGIIAAFNDLAGGSAAGDTLANFARQVTGASRADFEGLLGPLDTITQALPELSGAAAAFATVPWVADPLNDASDALRRLHRLGLGTALQLIATRAHGKGQDALNDGVGSLVTSLRVLANPGDRLTIGTLNYDGLVLAALRENDVADMARGYPEALAEVIPGVQLPSLPLRTTDDLPDDRPVHLLQLHGSLGWIRSGLSIRKFRIDDLRTNEYWSQVSRGLATSEPVVVLTDRKDTVVQTFPFGLAYEIFRNRLLKASHWCVAGYSFLDVPVNRALENAIAIRRSLGYLDPKLLILGYDDITVLTKRVTEALGGALLADLFVDGGGLPGSVGGATWNAWSTA